MLGYVTVCNRQLCVDRQWCFIVEDTDCYCIIYILSVSVHETIHPITNS
jgi:hypothetical protein